MTDSQGGDNGNRDKGGKAAAQARKVADAKGKGKQRYQSDAAAGTSSSSTEDNQQIIAQMCITIQALVARVQVLETEMKEMKKKRDQGDEKGFK